MEKSWYGLIILMVGLFLFGGCGRGADDGGQTPEESAGPDTPQGTDSDEKPVKTKELEYIECESVEGIYVIIEEGEKQFPEDRLQYTDEAGDISFSDYHASGTPYETVGL